jgi:thymidylate synthase
VPERGHQPFADDRVGLLGAPFGGQRALPPGFVRPRVPAALPEMALPPCHMFAQFYVEEGELSCQMYQRSGDMFLGVPFNIASTAFLVSILAHMTGRKPGSVFLCIGDAHIYQSHLDAVGEQVSRDPSLYAPPTLRILCEPKERIEDYQFEDFEMADYVAYPSIRAAMIA